MKTPESIYYFLNRYCYDPLVSENWDQCDEVLEGFSVFLWSPNRWGFGRIPLENQLFDIWSEVALENHGQL